MKRPVFDTSRRPLALLCAACLCFVFLCPAAALTMGDADLDGEVTAADARAVLRAAVELEALTAEGKLLSDMDADAEFTSADARAVLRTAVGLDAQRAVNTGNGFENYKKTVVDTSEQLYTYTDLCADLKRLAELFPSRFSFSSLGVTADGRDIFCAVLGTGHGARQIVADAAIHGCEYLTPAGVLASVEYCLRNYDTAVYRGKTVRQILADTDVYLFPMLNPDGVAISQSGLDGLQNESVADRVLSIYNARRADGSTSRTLEQYLLQWKANANGVDLNRNYAFSSAPYVYDTGVRRPADEGYKGDPRSPEPETRAYVRLVERLPHVAAVVSFHSQGNLIYWDCSQSAAGKRQARALANAVSGETGYYLDMSDSFVCASADWAMIEKGIPAVTVECGRGSTPLPLSWQPKIAAAVKNVFLAVAELYNS